MVKKMQRYTEMMLHDIKQTHYQNADNAFSNAGASLISGRNVGAYGRKFQEFYTIALENIVKDIFKHEQQALSSLEDIPNEQYFLKLKEDILAFVDRELHLLDVKFMQKLAPHKKTANIQIMQNKSYLIHDFVCSKSKQIKEVLELEKNKAAQTPPVINNTVNNYATISTLSQGKDISNTKHETVIHNPQHGWLQKVAIPVGMLAAIVTIINFITGWFSHYLKLIISYFST